MLVFYKFVGDLFTNVASAKMNWVCDMIEVFGNDEADKEIDLKSRYVRVVIAIN